MVSVFEKSREDKIIGGNMKKKVETLERYGNGKESTVGFTLFVVFFFFLSYVVDVVIVNFVFVH